MAGLLSGIGDALGGLFSGDGQMRLARAMAYMNDDWQGAARISASMQDNARSRQEAEAERKQLLELRQSLVNLGYTGDQINALMTDPKSVAALTREKLTPKQFGPGGGSLAAPNASGVFETTFQAPRWDDDNSYWGQVQGAAVPEAQIRGTKTIPIPENGTVGVFDAISGQEIGAGAGGLADELTDDDIDAFESGLGSGNLDAITMDAESRGRRYGANGELLRSPAGAMGEMQVMPETARNPGFGVRPWNGSDPEDLARVGRDYRGAMENRYDGDLAKMWGAYNWGPGNVDRAVNRFGTDWLANAPRETQGYVRRNLRAAGRR